MNRLKTTLEAPRNTTCGYDGRVLWTSLCPMGRVNKAMDNQKTLPTALVLTHRLLAHIPTRLNNNYFLTETKPLKSNTYFEATTLLLLAKEGGTPRRGDCDRLRFTQTARRDAK